MQDFLSGRSNIEDVSDVSSMKSGNSQMSDILSQSGVLESTIERIAKLESTQQAMRERNEHIIESTEKMKMSECHRKTMSALLDYFRRKDKNVVFWADFFAILKESAKNTGDFGEEKDYRA